MELTAATITCGQDDEIRVGATTQNIIIFDCCVKISEMNLQDFTTLLLKELLPLGKLQMFLSGDMWWLWWTLLTMHTEVSQQKSEKLDMDFRTRFPNAARVRMATHARSNSSCLWSWDEERRGGERCICGTECRCCQQTTRRGISSEESLHGS